MMPPSLAAIRAELFGEDRYTSGYMVQAWYTSTAPNGTSPCPAVWRQRFARTLAGANRIVQGRGLARGLTVPCRIIVLRLSVEADYIAHDTQEMAT